MLLANESALFVLATVALFGGSGEGTSGREAGPGREGDSNYGLVLRHLQHCSVHVVHLLVIGMVSWTVS